MNIPPQAGIPASANRPRMVCLCGSTRFWDELAETNLRETAAGRIVLAPGVDMKRPHELWGDPTEAADLKQRLDSLHRWKIRVADEVVVVNPGGYIGDSTRAEIAYAQQLGKPIRYTHQQPAIREATMQYLDPDDPAVVYAQAPDLAREAADLQETADNFPTRTAADTRLLVLRKAAYLDRAALELTTAGTPASEADRLAEQAALDLRRHDHAFGGRIGHVPPHAREFADGRSRVYARQEYREYLAGHIVPVSQCSHYDNCPTTECAYGEGYYDRPEQHDPAFPVDRDLEPGTC